MPAGCGGSQPPIGAPGMMPQASAIATHAERGKSWMAPEATSEDLVYVTGGCGGTCVVSYPAGKIVGYLNLGNGLNAGVCSDSGGNVYISNNRESNDSEVVEYAHGGTTPKATFDLPGFDAAGCSVDPTTGNLAVMFEGSGDGVAIFTSGANRMAELCDVAADDEVKRLDLLSVRLAGVQRGQRLYHLRAANGDLADGHALLEVQRLCRQTQRSAHDGEPRLGDPATIIAPGISRIHQVP